MAGASYFVERRKKDDKKRYEKNLDKTHEVVLISKGLTNYMRSFLHFMKWSQESDSISQQHST